MQFQVHFALFPLVETEFRSWELGIGNWELGMGHWELERDKGEIYSIIPPYLPCHPESSLPFT
jgi:hypothetical protein